MLGGWEWAIILVVALLIFGGSRLAGLGKGVGRSIREFREEVKTDGKSDDSTEVVDAEIVQPNEDAALAKQRELEQRERDLAAREQQQRDREHDTDH